VRIPFTPIDVPGRLIAAAAAALALVLALGWVQHQLSSLAQQRDAAVHAEAMLREQHNRMVADAGAELARADARYRAIEAQMTAQERIADAALTAEKTRNAAAAAGLRADVGSLQHALAAAWGDSAASGAAAGDASAQWRERAAACGALLVDGVRVQAALAEGAESRAAEVRRLLERERNTSCGGG
jgi:hypothetical protein